MVHIAPFAASPDICIWLGSAPGSITHWVLDLVIASTVLTLIDTITETGTFWLYAAFGVIFFIRVVPETKGRSPEEI